MSDDATTLVYDEASGEYREPFRLVRRADPAMLVPLVGYRVEVEAYEQPHTTRPALRVVRYPPGSNEPDALLCADGTWWECPGPSRPIPPETGAAALPLGKSWRACCWPGGRW